ncbi:aquaporin [Streptacidiphilus neutrinimicus]|uniref:aquaporin n=1 Tax=Streptacidiphilus neutrinimicus TaxID=105420 RepID=UPI0009FEF115|nr:MIP/aquaporin family protein [Streptacidiphilus neutrinimicus]
MLHPLARRLGGEFVGTLALVAVVVGSGIQAQRLTPDTGEQLLANALVSALGLGVLIALLGPVSGAHLNPVVTLAAWWTGRRDGRGPRPAEVAAYTAAQVAGAIGGALLADGMFGGPVARFSRQGHDGVHLWLGEVVATAGLVLLVVGLGRTGREAAAPVLVAAYIGAAIWFTSSGSFANPAATVGRAFTDSFTGIAPRSVLPFVFAQLVGAAVGLALAPMLFGRTAVARWRRSGVGVDADACPPGPRPAPDGRAV